MRQAIIDPASTRCNVEGDDGVSGSSGHRRISVEVALLLWAAGRLIWKDCKMRQLAC